MQNGEVDVRWYLSSFAPPYVKVLLFFNFFIPSGIQLNLELLLVTCSLGHHGIEDSGKAPLALPQGVDNTGDVYRATYTAFRCSSVSGTLGAHEKMQVG